MMQLEADEGKNLREDQKSGPSAARQSRKQFKEMGELALGLIEALEE